MNITMPAMTREVQNILADRLSVCVDDTLSYDRLVIWLRDDERALRTCSPKFGSIELLYELVEVEQKICYIAESYLEEDRHQKKHRSRRHFDDGTEIRGKNKSQKQYRKQSKQKRGKNYDL